MNKRLKYLSIIPLCGTCILFVYLFVLCLKDKISKKKFFKSFIVFISVCCIFGFLFFILWLILRKNKDEILLNN